METNILKSILETYKQYLFGRVNAEIINRGKHIYIECLQCKDSITYESGMVFDISGSKPILKRLSFEIHKYELDGDVLFMMESNTDLYMHETLMIILDTVLTKSLKVEGIIYSNKYGSTKE